jgi:hypothetical protein
MRHTWMSIFWRGISIFLLALGIWSSVEASSIPEPKELFIPVEERGSISARAGWQVVPGSLSVGLMRGEVVTRTLTITNTGLTSADYVISGFQDPVLRIVSDSNWRVSSEYAPGWELIHFDDTAWDCALAPAPVNCGWENCWDDPNVFTMWSVDQYETIYLRKPFVIADAAAVHSAAITTRCDDDHDLYINGTLVASDWDGYAGPIVDTDITKNLVTGDNLIAIKASDTHGGCRHMCVDAYIHFEASTPDWLVSEPRSGAIPAQVSVTVQVAFDAAHLNRGVYPATLEVASGDAGYPTVEVPVMMTVNARYQARHLPVILNNEPP